MCGPLRASPGLCSPLLPRALSLRTLPPAARAAPTIPLHYPRLRVPCYGASSVAVRLALNTHGGRAEMDSTPGWGGYCEKKV